MTYRDTYGFAFGVCLASFCFFLLSKGMTKAMHKRSEEMNKRMDVLEKLCSPSSLPAPTISTPIPDLPPSSPDPTAQKLGDGPSTSCFQGWVCNCEDERKFCLDPSLGHYVICSKGLVLTFEEYDAFNYGELLYSNACRPKDQPLLNPCVIGGACDEQSLMNREVCVSTGNRLAICNNGRVLDFSNPEARRLVKSESCEDPPPPCASPSGSDSISL